tara:strand:+ start:661 stop:1311 length:651 start_codon:yes stop_codon:yes gene_type:complete
MVIEKKLSMAIDSSLSYCSITVFKNEKILWNIEKKCNFGHEKHLALMLSKMVDELSISPKNFSSLYLNFGPARFTCIRSCHSLIKGFFIHQPVKIYAFTIFEHFFLGLKDYQFQTLACILDTNRRDIGIQTMNEKGQTIDDFQTLSIDEDLILKLDEHDLIIGNGINKIKNLDSFSKIKEKCVEPMKLKSKYLMKRFYKKNPLKKIPKIIYPYSPI